MMLVTLATAKEFLGITSTASDSALNLLIEAASVAVESYLSRSLLSANVTEIQNGNGTELLWLRNFPVTAVNSVKVNGKVVPITTDFYTSGVRYTDSVLIYQGGIFPKGYSNIEVNYTGGYLTLPMDIQRAVAEIAGLGLKQREHLDVSSKSLAGETISYVMTSMPKSTKEVLESYRQVIPV